MTAVSQRVREQGRMRAVLVTIDLLLRYKPMSDEYIRSLLWIRRRLEKNLKGVGEW